MFLSSLRPLSLLNVELNKIVQTLLSPFITLLSKSYRFYFHSLLVSIYLFIYLFIVVLGFELRVSGLLGKHSTTWASPPAVFEIGSHYSPWQALKRDLPDLCLLYSKDSAMSYQRSVLFKFLTTYQLWISPTKSTCYFSHPFTHHNENENIKYFFFWQY
jgi:hypothetical protein